MSLDQQRAIYTQIRKKKLEKRFVDYNPLLAIKHNMPQSHQQVMSFNDYYARYGTTEETDGWRRQYIAEQQKTVFVK